jgi:hypothetical protein
MDKSPPPLSLTAALALPLPPGRRTAETFVDGDLEIRFYAPTGHDPQPAHNRGEIYIVAAATFFGAWPRRGGLWTRDVVSAWRTCRHSGWSLHSANIS